MKNLLPTSIKFSASKTLKNPQGFTLIELLVVIAIIAVLATIGAAVFSNVQKNGRDAARRADIESIANAMEANYNTATNLYTPLATSMFAAGAIPTGYGGAATYSNIPSAAADTASYKVCAVLEAGSTFCRQSQQR